MPYKDIEKRKECSKKWRQEHPNRIKELLQKWDKEYPERRKELFKKWKEEHLEEYKAYQKQYHQEHKYSYNPIIEHRSYLKHREERCNKTRIYLKTPKGKETNRRHHSRQKEFDFIPLNKYFDGADFHHWNNNYGSYMPREAHQSIYHSVLKNRNMDEINALAFNYLNL